jgi:multiple sugar transport system permease protein
MPFYVVVITSFKTKVESMNVFTWWPKTFSLEGYIDALTYTSGDGDTMPTIVRGFINTLITTIPPVFIGVLVSALAAFAFAKMNFKSKKVLFSILLSTMIIPGTISMIPSYVIFDKIGWIDTFLPLIVPGLFGGASIVFFLRQFYFSIPDDLISAAKIDGLSNIQIFFTIILPLSVPALIAQFVLTFVGSYNAYLGPLLYLQSPDKYTLQIALSFFRGTYATNWSVVMAGSVLSLLPTLIIYFVGQKFFVQGIATSGMKL